MEGDAAPFAIRPFRDGDWPLTWRVLEPVFRAGDIYGVDPGIPPGRARATWTDPPRIPFVALDGGEIVGTYYLRTNKSGPGSHVCNCGYVVAAHARRRGVASAMCEHSQREAIRRGYRAMQYNFVVSTNTGAIRLWKRHGFHIAGTLPGAFLHPREGYVDAYVMFKTLVPSPRCPP